jgi:hypothetical protein
MPKKLPTTFNSALLEEDLDLSAAKKKSYEELAHATIKAYFAGEIDWKQASEHLEELAEKNEGRDAGDDADDLDAVPGALSESERRRERGRRLSESALAPKPLPTTNADRQGPKRGDKFLRSILTRD